MLNSIKKSVSIKINLKAFSSNILKYYVTSFFTIFKTKSIQVTNQPVKYKSLTLLRSPQKYKRAQEHYQLKVYKSTLVIKDVNVSNLMFLLSNKPHGVQVTIKIQEHAI
jgi:ribosomal protein S10